MSRSIVIKPHHFLDIIKLYGSGLEEFVPDRKYNHDFYRVGNIILENKKTELILTLECDDICKPCKFLKKGRCIDKIENLETYFSKEEFNRLIDKRLFKQLDLREGQRITALDFCYITQRKLKDIFKIWGEEPYNKTAMREKNLLKGIDKYINS